MRFRLLDVVQNALCVGVGDNAAKVGCSIVADSRAQNDSLRILLLKQLQHIQQRERTADIRIQHEEAFRLAFQDGIAEVVETASGSQRGVFSQVLDLQLRELLGRVLDEITEDGLVIVTDQNNFPESRNLRNSLEAMVDDGVAGDLE